MFTEGQKQRLHVQLSCFTGSKPSLSKFSHGDNPLQVSDIRVWTCPPLILKYPDKEPHKEENICMMSSNAMRRFQTAISEGVPCIRSNTPTLVLTHSHPHVCGAVDTFKRTGLFRVPVASETSSWIFSGRLRGAPHVLASGKTGPRVYNWTMLLKFKVQRLSLSGYIKE